MIEFAIVEAMKIDKEARESMIPVHHEGGGRIFMIAMDEKVEEALAKILVMDTIVTADFTGIVKRRSQTGRLSLTIKMGMGDYKCRRLGGKGSLLLQLLPLPTYFHRTYESVNSNNIHDKALQPTPDATTTTIHVIRRVSGQTGLSNVRQQYRP